MKKNIIKMLFLSLIVTAMISCDENDNEENIYTGDNFISFGTNTSASVLESASDIITITAYASVPNITSDINVDFEVINEQGTNSDYSIVDGKSQFNFGTGKYVDTIEIIPIDNLVEDGDKIINITLTSASDGSFIGHPGPDGKGKTFSVTLEDDDCAFTVQELGDSTWSGTDNATGNQGPNDSKVTTSFDGTNLLIEGLSYGWMTNTAYWNEVIVDSFPVIAITDTKIVFFLHR